MDEGDDAKVDFNDVFKRFNKQNESKFIPLPLLMGRRETSQKHQRATIHHIEKWSEESLISRKYTQLPCKLPGVPKSTFLMVFSPDGTKVASTHGDHNIYVTDVKTGKCLCTLEGHSRTPWCIAFHPSSNDVIASGCLGGQVRVWDLQGRSEVWSTKRNAVIASLAFHPTDQVLVIAVETEIHFWNWFHEKPFAKISTGNEKEKVKYVKFDPLGYRLITGIANGSERHLDSLHGSHSSSSGSSSTSNSNEGSSSPATNTFRRSATISLSAAIRDQCRAAGRNSHAPREETPSQDQNANLDSMFGLTDGIGNDGASSTTTTGSALPRMNTRSATTRGSNSRDVRDPFISEYDSTITELRHPLRPISDDGASSSSVDSSSSVSSSVSGSSNERNTRLSLLWTSRMNRNGAESDNSGGGGGGFDLEERRGEGSVLRGEAGDISGLAGSSRTEARNDSYQNDFREESSHRQFRILRRHPLYRRPTGGAHAQEATEQDDQDSDNETPPYQTRAANHMKTRCCGQGGRWMYYKSKYASVLPPRKNHNARNLHGSHPYSTSDSQNRSRASSRQFANDDSSLAGPSSSRTASSTTNSSDLPSFQNDSNTFFNNGATTSPASSLLDPHHGVQLLSRHIENMQRICRSLSIPRSHFELTRHRHDISRLQQIHSMLFDIQNQIWSLSASVDQTLNEDFSGPTTNQDFFSGASNENNPHVAAEAQSVETLANPFSSLAEEDPEQSLLDLSMPSTSGSSNVLSNSEDVNFSSASATSTPRIPRSSDSSTRLGYSTRSNGKSLSRLQRAPPSTRLKCKTPSSMDRYRHGCNNSKRLLPQRRSTRSRLNLSAPLHVPSGLSRESISKTSCGLTVGNRVFRRFTSDSRESRGVHSGRSGNSSLQPESVSSSSNRSNLHRGSSSSTASRSSPVENPQQSLTLGDRVRRRHSGDWQRRLRSILASDQERQSNGGTRNDSSSPAGASSNNLNLSPNLPSDDDLDLFAPGGVDLYYHRRIRRAGPPTTSLASRIATMLAQQEAATSNHNTNTESSTSGGSTSRPPWSSDSPTREWFSRNNPENNSSVPFSDSSSSNFLSPSPSFAGYYEERESSARMQNLQAFRRELMAARRNRLLRRAHDTLVTGRDLAGATLDALNTSFQSERERRRDHLRQERMESYRQILQQMAERLRSLMYPDSLLLEMEEEASDILNDEIFTRLGRLNERRPPDLPPRHAPSTPGRRNLHNSNGHFLGGPQNLPNVHTHVDTRMLDLRLLMRLALRLIYQLLNFMYSQNVSYEERPISRLPNPFREEDLHEQRDSTAALAASSTNTNESNSYGQLDLESDPGLNLTTLLETVRMASAELRNDATPTTNASGSFSTTPYPNFLSRPPADSHLPSSEASQEGNSNVNADSPERDTTPGPNVRQRLTDFLLRTSLRPNDSSSSQPRRNSSSLNSETARGGSNNESGSQSSFLVRPLPTSQAGNIREILHIPNIVLNDRNRETPAQQEIRIEENHLSGPSISIPADSLESDMRTVGGIPLRFLGRQNAVDRRSPDLDDSNGGAEANEGQASSRNEHSFSLYAPFSRPLINDSWTSSSFAQVNFGGGRSQQSSGVASHSRQPQESDVGYLPPYMFFTRPYHTLSSASRPFAGHFLDTYFGNNHPTHRLQVWDFNQCHVPDISDSFFNVVVSKCKIHFDASVAISPDGALIVAIIPDTQPLVKIGVFSLKEESLGQQLYSGTIDSNAICVSISPTMKHLVIGIASYQGRLGIHHNEKQIVARIYKLNEAPVFSKKSLCGELQFLRGIENQTDHRQISLNCIRWLPHPGQGLIYGTNRGELTILH